MAEGSSAFSVRPLNAAPQTSGVELPKAGAVGSLLVKNGQDIKDVAWTTKGALASDVAFSGLYQPIVVTDGDISTKTAGVPGEITRASLATDTAFSTRYQAIAADGTYTPTLTGMAVGTGGNARNDAYYTFIGGLLFIKGQILFGTAGATLPGAGGDLRVSLPSGYAVKDIIVHPVFGNGVDDVAPGWWIARGGAVNAGVVRLETTTTARFLVADATGTYLGGGGGTSATVPFAWAAGNSITYSFVTRATGP